MPPRGASTITPPRARQKPEGRTERQVAADTVLRLALAELLKAGASIRHVCLAAGITEGDLHDARVRHAQRPLGTPCSPSARTPTAEAGTPRADPDWQPSAHGGGRARIIRDGKKRCPRCTFWKPLTAFGRMNAAGRPKSMCIPCTKDYQKERYLDLDRQGALAVGLFILRDVDTKALRLKCPDCGDRFCPGEAVKLIGELRHQTCPTEPTRRRRRS